jgi:ElaB/YqjD/DUF883 family membrane-anchored ribosome-binding protein
METPDNVTPSVHKTADKIAAAAGQAGEVLEENGQRLKAAEQRAMEQCRGYVRDNPMTSVAIAIGAGVVLSRLLSVH